MDTCLIVYMIANCFINTGNIAIYPTYSGTNAEFKLMNIEIISTCNDSLRYAQNVRVQVDSSNITNPHTGVRYIPTVRGIIPGPSINNHMVIMYMKDPYTNKEAQLKPRDIEGFMWMTIFAESYCHLKSQKVLTQVRLFVRN